MQGVVSHGVSAQGLRAICCRLPRGRSLTWALISVVGLLAIAALVTFSLQEKAAARVEGEQIVKKFGGEIRMISTAILECWKRMRGLGGRYNSFECKKLFERLPQQIVCVDFGVADDKQRVQYWTRVMEAPGFLDTFTMTGRKDCFFAFFVGAELSDGGKASRWWLSDGRKWRAVVKYEKWLYFREKPVVLLEVIFLRP